MVHALEEVHRVLTPHGYLIDLRPCRDPLNRHGTLPQVSCVWDDQEVRVGVLEEPLVDDLAADRASRQVLRRRLFTLQTSEPFRFRTYFRTLAIFDKFRGEATASAPRTWSDASFRTSSRRRLLALLRRHPLAQVAIVEILRLNVLRKQ